jgi:hypothetical protein
VLPEAVESFLSEQRASKAAQPELLEALKSGLLFAMDIKDAGSVAPENSDDIEECEDARPYLAGDIWLAILRHDQEDGSETRAVSSGSEEVLQEFFDELGNYRFFRYLGASAPKSLDDAFATVFRDFFFPPTHVWIAGKFIDMADVREVRVDGKIIYSTSPGWPAADGPAATADVPNQPPPPSYPTDSASSPRDRWPFIARLDVRKWEPGLYEYIVSYSGQELYAEAGFNSISAALESASETEGDLAGFEVSYAGYIVGTYPVDVLKATAEEVAQRAVDTASPLRWR